jgi:hypothetical protein
MKTLVWVALALAVAAPAADAATACVRRNGRIVLRPACRAAERPFDPGAFVVPGPAGPAGPQGPAGAPGTFPLRVVDAEAQDVGDVWELHPSGSAWVRIARPPLTEPVLFRITPRGFGNGATGQPVVWYASPDCVGTPYVFRDASDVPRANVFGTAAYYSTGLPVDLAAQSAEYDYSGAPCPTGSDPTPRATCCHDETAEAPHVAAAVRVDVGRLGLVPPFRAVPREEIAE